MIGRVASPISLISPPILLTCIFTGKKPSKNVKGYRNNLLVFKLVKQGKSGKRLVFC